MCIVFLTVKITCILLLLLLLFIMPRVFRFLVKCLLLHIFYRRECFTGKYETTSGPRVAYCPYPH